MRTYTVDTPLNDFREEVTAAMLKAAILKLSPTSPLAADSICNQLIESGKKYNVDQVYLLAHAVLESAWGTSNFARERNNLYGYKAYTSDPNKAEFFASKEQCIDFITSFVSRAYLAPSGQWFGGTPTLKGMNVHYATATHWSNSIATIANRIELAMDTPTQPAKEYKLFPHQRNVEVTSDKGVNIRTIPEASDDDLTVKRPEPKGNTLAVEGFVEGGMVDKNNLWWKLKDENLYAWTGATNVVPTIPTEPTPPINSEPVGSIPREQLEEELARSKADLQTVIKAIGEKDSEITRLQTEKEALNNRILGLEETVNNIEGIKVANSTLQETVEVLNGKVKEIQKDQEGYLADEFKKWNLVAVPKGPMALAHLPLLGLKLFIIAKTLIFSGGVLGLKKGAKLYKV